MAERTIAQFTSEQFTYLAGIASEIADILSANPDLVKPEALIKLLSGAYQMSEALEFEKVELTNRLPRPSRAAGGRRRRRARVKA